MGLKFHQLGAAIDGCLNQFADQGERRDKSGRVVAGAAAGAAAGGLAYTHRNKLKEGAASVLEKLKGKKKLPTLPAVTKTIKVGHGVRVPGKLRAARFSMIEEIDAVLHQFAIEEEDERLPSLGRRAASAAGLTVAGGVGAGAYLGRDKLKKAGVDAGKYVVAKGREGLHHGMRNSGMAMERGARKVAKVAKAGGTGSELIGAAGKKLGKTGRALRKGSMAFFSDPSLAKRMDAMCERLARLG